MLETGSDSHGGFEGGGAPETHAVRGLGALQNARSARRGTADALRDQLTAQGVEVMDGDPLGWEWKLGG